MVGNRARGSWDGSPQVGSRDKVPAGGLGNEVQQKLKCEISVKVLTFLHKI